MQTCWLNRVDLKLRQHQVKPDQWFFWERSVGDLGLTMHRAVGDKPRVRSIEIFYPSTCFSTTHLDIFVIGLCGFPNGFMTLHAHWLRLGNGVDTIGWHQVVDPRNADVKQQKWLKLIWNWSGLLAGDFLLHLCCNACLRPLKISSQFYCLLSLALVRLTKFRVQPVQGRLPSVNGTFQCEGVLALSQLHESSGRSFWRREMHFEDYDIANCVPSPFSHHAKFLSPSCLSRTYRTKCRYNTQTFLKSYFLGGHRENPFMAVPPDFSCWKSARRSLHNKKLVNRAHNIFKELDWVIWLQTFGIEWKYFNSGSFIASFGVRLGNCRQHSLSVHWTSRV